MTGVAVGLCPVSSTGASAVGRGNVGDMENYVWQEKDSSDCLRSDDLGASTGARTIVREDARERAMALFRLEKKGASDPRTDG